MRCVKAVQQLQLYIDKQLTLDQLRTLETHLSTCVTCQKELLLLEEINLALRGIKAVTEPADLTANIMRRVMVTPQYNQKPAYLPLRPSLPEMLAVMLLATIATLGIILVQPALRAVLPFANGHDSLSLAFSNTLRLLMGFSSNTLIWAVWIIGTMLGVIITWALAGDDMRTVWLKAMTDRLPVW